MNLRIDSFFILGYKFEFMGILEKKIQQDIYKTGSKCGMDEKTPSYSQYFSWINNTNEGSTEKQTLTNLNFFKWLYDEFGMILDIYAFDAGNLDGPNNRYGNINSNKFKNQFPNGFKIISDKASQFKCRLGMWGGPDGYGETSEDEDNRHNLIVSLCKDNNFCLFKIDGVCGRLRHTKQGAYIKTLIECRKYVPDLIVLNHRLMLGKAFPYVTTFLLGGKETYIDIHMANQICAPHHREEALERAPPTDLTRLTEDHGVCISSCNDYWEDDLILQAFNRCLILAPEIYGNPWLLPDWAYPKLARIFNLHRSYRDIMVNGITLPKEQYGMHAVSRGNGNTRFITLRNLEWEPKSFKISLDESIGLEFNLTSANNKENKVFVYKFHPYERFLGTYSQGNNIEVIVAPFRSYLLAISTNKLNEVGIIGCNYEIIHKMDNKPLKINLLGLPGTTAKIKLISLPNKKFTEARLDGKLINEILTDTEIDIKFNGNLLKNTYHRKICDLEKTNIPKDAEGLYEATCFAADNNALEFCEQEKVGKSMIPQVQAARDAFFEQPIMIVKGIYDKYAFDGDKSTFFRTYTRDKIKDRAFRIDFGEIIELDRLNIWGNYLVRDVKLTHLRNISVEGSIDLIKWEKLHFTFSEAVFIELNKKPVRYLRITKIVNEICSIEGLINGKSVDRTKWRASNLFSHYKANIAKKSWTNSFVLDEIPKNSYLAVAIHGVHRFEGAYASFRIDGKLVGSPDRAPSFPSNTWESWWRKGWKNYTYYLPLNSNWIGKKIEVVVLGLKKKIKISPEVWITTYPVPFEKKELIISEIK